MNKEMKICLAVKAFLKNPSYSMIELSKLPELENMSSSSIQRYLNDPLIIKLFDQATFNKIQEMLKENNINGKRKGGINFFKKNDSIKDENGKFVGSTKTLKNDKLDVKVNHILTFAYIFINYPKMSLQEIADFYNHTNPFGETVTRDYVYDCLSSKEQYNILASELWNIISRQLEERRYSGNVNGANMTNNSKIK